MSRRVRCANGVPVYETKVLHQGCGPLKGRFLFMQKKERKSIPSWKKLLFSPVLAEKNTSHKIAYIALVTAFVVVANMFFEFKLAETQFSFTVLVSCVAGILIGPLFGGAACFLGDLVGFLYNSGGFGYLPWIGISLCLMAMISGLTVGIANNKKPRWFLYIDLSIICVLTFVICTVAINTTAFWILYSKVDYTTYLISRLFVQGQIWNSLVNYALLFVVVPALNRIKPLRISAR